jgi:hypothetical protein
MGFPASVAVTWHVTSRVAVRPEVSFDSGSNEVEVDLPIIGGNETSTDVFTTRVGASALFFLGASDRLRTYLSPGVLYVRTSTDTDAPVPIALDRTLDGFQVSGSFGAQYAVGDRFTVFSEVGLAYSKTTSTLGLGTPFTPEGEVRIRNLGTRTTAGVTFYF